MNLEFCFVFNLNILNKNLHETILTIGAIKSDPLERDSMPLYHAGQIHIYYGRWAE